MRVNILAGNYRDFDGYGRFAAYIVKALKREGHQVVPLLADQVHAPAWLHDAWEIDWSVPSISILPPFYLNSTPSAGSGPHWLYTMTEGSALPPGWAEKIAESNVERVIVPCQHNAVVFREGGVTLPIHVVAGGTEGDDFPLVTDRPQRPYTFLALADRGARKGWVEVWQAFYKAFGTPDDTPDVRLIIKARPDGNDMLEMIASADPGTSGRDPRINILFEDMADMADFYRMGDCGVFVSRSEGWGMPMRECAAMGLPVITQQYSGMDDGHTDQWAILIDGGKLESIPAHFDHIAGDWKKADVSEVAKQILWCYNNPGLAKRIGVSAAIWLRQHQGWNRTAQALIDLLESKT